MKIKSDQLRLGLLAAGAIFLFNPTIHIVDLLPDFIGYWLIVCGLTLTAYISDTVAAARKSFVYLAFVEGAKLASCVLLVGANGTFVVLMAFTFSVLEAILFLPAVNDLFEGFASLGVRHAGKWVFSVPVSPKKLKRAKKLEALLAGESDEKKRSAIAKRIMKCRKEKTIDQLKTLTVVAFLVRAVGAVVPVLPNLMMYGDTLFISPTQINWQNFTGIYYILVWALGFGVGIPWLKAFRRYWKQVAGEEQFVSSIYSKCYDEVLCDKGRLCADMMKKVMVISVIAAIFTLVFPVDLVNVTPNLIVAGLFIAVFAYLKSYCKRIAVFGIVSCSVWAVISAVGIILQQNFRSNNYRPSIVVNGPVYAQKLYFQMEIFSYIEAALFLVCALIFAWVFMTALNSHIAMMPPRKDGLERDSKKLKSCLKPVAISGGVVIAFSAVLTFVTKWLQGAWLINALAVAVLAVFAIRAYYSLWDNVYIPLKRKF